MRPCKSEPVIHGMLPTTTVRQVSGLTVVESGPAFRCGHHSSHLASPSSVSPASSYCDETDLHIDHEDDQGEDEGNFFFAASHNWAASSLSLDSGDFGHYAEEDLISDMLTIESLRSTFNSCMSCGVSWHENHVSLDCGECDGYSMSRPCPSCDGKCGAMWERNVRRSHNSQKACWEGECQMTNCVQSFPALFVKPPEQ